MNFDWKDNGFAALPVRRLAGGAERLYRAWGGAPQRKWGNTDLPGVCFSLDKATSRRQAEALYAVMEYSNPVLWITEFTIASATPMWEGPVDPGDPRALLGKVSGRQVLIERAFLRFISEGSTERLRDDLAPYFVAMRRPPSRPS